MKAYVGELAGLQRKGQLGVTGLQREKKLKPGSLVMFPTKGPGPCQENELLIFL